MSSVRENHPDRDVSKPTGFGRTSWWRVAKRTWQESSRDNVAIIAAGVSFYAFLAFIPLLASIVLVYGLVTDPETVVAHVRRLNDMMPAEAAGFVGDQLKFVVQTSSDKSGLGLLTALAISLFGVRAAAASIITALNIAYEEEERRSLVRGTLAALGIAGGGVLFAVFGLVAAASIAALQDLLPSSSPVLVTLLKFIGNILLTFGIAVVAAGLYKFGPCRQQARWSWVIPGAVFFAVVWTLLTLGFGFYVSNFGSYGATYGSLATIVIFLTWMYIASYAFLLGAELNSELEHETARDSTTGPERPLGERGAWMADHVASG